MRPWAWRRGRSDGRASVRRRAPHIVRGGADRVRVPGHRPCNRCGGFRRSLRPHHSLNFVQLGEGLVVLGVWGVARPHPPRTRCLPCSERSALAVPRGQGSPDEPRCRGRRFRRRPHHQRRPGAFTEEGFLGWQGRAPPFRARPRRMQGRLLVRLLGPTCSGYGKDGIWKDSTAGPRVHAPAPRRRVERHIDREAGGARAHRRQGRGDGLQSRSSRPQRLPGRKRVQPARPRGALHRGGGCRRRRQARPSGIGRPHPARRGEEHLFPQGGA